MNPNRRVDFLIMGAQKSGTTALTYFLMQHPQIYIPEFKEVHFFDDDLFFERSSAPVDYRAYHRDFEVPPGVDLVGDATPIYIYWERAARRIQEYNPSIKMIFVLRNPIDRAYSHYMFQRSMDDERLPFSLAVRIERFRNLSNFPRQSRAHSYVDRGYYARQVRRLLQCFSLSQMLFLKTEELKDDHSSTLDRVFDFLGVCRVADVEPELINCYEYEPMPRSDRIYLKRKFEHDIRDLEKLLGWDCSEWLNGS